MAVPVHLGLVLEGVLLAAAVAVVVFGAIGAVRLATFMKRHRLGAPGDVVRFAAEDGLAKSFEPTDLPFRTFFVDQNKIRQLVCRPSPLGTRQWTFEHVRDSDYGRFLYGIVLMEVPTSWPQFGVERRGNKDNHAGISHTKERSFPEDPAFDEAFFVMCDDDLFARSFLWEGVRAELLARNDLCYLESNVGLMLFAFDVGDVQYGPTLTSRVTCMTDLLDHTPPPIWGESIDEQAVADHIETARGPGRAGGEGG